MYNVYYCCFNALQAGAPIPTDPNVYLDPSDEVTVYVGSAGGFKVDDFSISRMLAALVQVRMVTQKNHIDQRGMTLKCCR